MVKGQDSVELFGSTPTTVGRFTALVGWVGIEKDPPERAAIEILDEDGSPVQQAVLTLNERIQIGAEEWEVSAIERLEGPDGIQEGLSSRVELTRVGR